MSTHWSRYTHMPPSTNVVLAQESSSWQMGPQFRTAGDQGSVTLAREGLHTPAAAGLLLKAQQHNEITTPREIQPQPQGATRDATAICSYGRQKHSILHITQHPQHTRTPSTKSYPPTKTHVPEVEHMFSSSQHIFLLATAPFVCQ